MSIDVFEQHSTGNLVYEDELGLVRRDYDYSTMGGSLRIDGDALVIDRLKDSLPNYSILESHRLVSIETPGDKVIATVEISKNTIELQANK